MALEARLPAVVEGDELPADPEEGVSFARMAFARRAYVAATLLWTESFTASPELAADLTAANRFQAACAAALAGTERGRGESPSDSESRARWRTQALDWLSADLTASAALLNRGPPNSKRRSRNGSGDGRSTRLLPEFAMSRCWRKSPNSSAVSPRILAER